YPKLPGKLGFSRNATQDERGAVSGEKPLLHRSLRIENHRRNRKSGGELWQGADYCAAELILELARLRDSAPPRTDAPAKDTHQPAVAKKSKPLEQEKVAVPLGFEIVRRLDVAPGNLTVTPAG